MQPIDLTSQHRLFTKEPVKCPDCNALLDGATGASNSPVAGNLSVCLYCGALSVYAGSPAALVLEELADEAFLGLPMDTQRQLIAIQLAVRKVQAGKHKNR